MNVEANMRPTQASQQEIATAAYYLWEKEGCVHGHDTDYWQRAEAQLMANRMCGKATSCDTARPTNIATTVAQSLHESRQPAKKAARSDRRQAAKHMV